LPNASELDDAALVSRARGGDRWAEEALYHRHVDYVMGMAVRLLGNRQDAEDAIQETFALALDRLRGLREPESFRGWLATIAVRLIRRRLRRTKLLASLGLRPASEELDFESLAVDADAETRAELTVAGKALARVPANDRVAWMLHHVEGETLERVAELCGCSLATAKRRILAAARVLRQDATLEEET
jgi:RNA polymerase sigma-70 factor (ECF subfamily)